MLGCVVAFLSMCAAPQTVVVTPNRNYTVLEQKQLLLDMGDEAGVSEGWPVWGCKCMPLELVAHTRMHANTLLHTRCPQAELLDDSWAKSDKILEHGPIPGLDTYCLYSKLTGQSIAVTCRNCRQCMVSVCLPV